MASKRRVYGTRACQEENGEEDEGVVIEWAKKSITAYEQICEMTALTETAPGSIRLDVACTDVMGTAIGTLSVIGGVGTYTFTLTNSAGNKAQVAGTNGVNLQAGSASASQGTFSVVVHADNGAGSIFDRAFGLTAT